MNIYDIARETGYSSATVARAFSGKGYCSEKAKKVIFDVAKKMNYKPNLSAKALRSDRTNRILFCIPDICNPFYFKMIQGAFRVLEEKGYYAMLYATEKSLDNELHMIDLLSQKYCDGIILISFDFCDKNIAAIRASGRPVVLGNRYLGQKPEDCFDYVYVDHIYGMELATDHLIGVGCKNIALVTGDLKTQTTYERLQGYKISLRRAGITCDEKNILNGRYDTEGSYLAFKQFIESGRTCDGVIASNDLAAYGILRYCREAGINVPHDLKLVSFDNTDYAELCMPSLSSIDMCQYELGKSLAETLLSRIEGRDEVLNVNLKPTLVIRQSSGK